MRTIAGLALGLALNQQPAHGQNLKLIEPIDSLRNMKEMGVVVEDIPGLENVLSPATLKTMIEVRLRKAGIDVPIGDRKDPVDAFVPYLYVNINAVRNGPSGYVFSISLQFKRAVEVNNIDRNRNFLFATTWETGGLAMVPLAAVADIQEALDSCVTAFLHDYLTVNPAK